jgi:hypothetical protein
MAKLNAAAILGGKFFQIMKLNRMIRKKMMSHRVIPKLEPTIFVKIFKIVG